MSDFLWDTWKMRYLGAKLHYPPLRYAMPSAPVVEHNLAPPAPGSMVTIEECMARGDPFFSQKNRQLAEAILQMTRTLDPTSLERKAPKDWTPTVPHPLLQIDEELKRAGADAP